jgi:ArsR family transcriptional regulator
MVANILISEHPEEQISKFLSLIGQPSRIKILLVIGEQEACVCHLEAVLGMRQASISQHLMALRNAGLVNAHRDGRNIFYSLARSEVLEVLERAAQLTGIDPNALQTLKVKPVPGCPCPQCNPELDPKVTCQNKRPASKTIGPIKKRNNQDL